MSAHVYYCICGPEHEDDACPEHGEGEACPEHGEGESLGLTARDFDLIEVALDSAASSIQAGATLQNRGLDPLAREYLIALSHVERLRARVLP